LILSKLEFKYKTGYQMYGSTSAHINGEVI